MSDGQRGRARVVGECAVLGTAIRGRIGALPDTDPLDPEMSVEQPTVHLTGPVGTEGRGWPDGASAWLPVRVEFGSVVIGPWGVPGQKGCPTCASWRGDKAQTPERRAARETFETGYGAPDRHVQVFGATVVADLVADEVSRWHTSRSPRALGRLVKVRLDDLAISQHRFLPEPTCPDCGDQPDDSAGTAAISLRPQVKPRPDSSRIRDLRGESVRLVETYVDAEVGLVRALQRDLDSTFPTTGAPMGLRVGVTGSETGFGRELALDVAKLTSIAEAVERYGGVRPGGKRTVVRGTLRSLGSTALDPNIFGLHDDEHYRQPGYPYQRFHEDLELQWVWAYSFQRAEPVLIPETFGYYRMHEHSPGTRPIAYEISNGCALGGCLEEAILQGILETAERDAFLMTWYARLPVRRLDLGSALDRRIPLMAERIGHRSGYDVLAFDTTVEHGIPAAWVMAVDRTPGPTRPRVLCAAGSALDPERAISAAILELAPLLQWRVGTFEEEFADASAMVLDGGKVRSMHDHSLVNAHPDAFDRFTFLLEDETEHSIESSYRGTVRGTCPDLTDDLRIVLDRYLDRGQDVVVVDQTTPEQRAGDFSCVKVLIPGMLPMTFGHWARRTRGLTRLSTVPVELGYRDTALTEDQLNADPHPFP